MTSQINENIKLYQTFGYGSLNRKEFPAQLRSLGKQLQTKNYEFNGMKRIRESGNYIFQYTLSGMGELETADSTYLLRPGMAFLVSIPHRHIYRLCRNTHWEFIFLTMRGSYTGTVWEQILSSFGPVLDFSANPGFEKYLDGFYLDACSRPYNNPYTSSAAAYSFLMTLQQALNIPPDRQGSHAASSDRMEKILQYMESHLADSIGLEDIATHAGMSKYYLDRLFTRQTQIPCWTYFTKMRLEHAAKLLSSTDLPIREVAAECGFSSANYFNNVFRKYVGESAGQFRKTHVGMVDFTLKL